MVTTKDYIENRIALKIFIWLSEQNRLSHGELSDIILALERATSIHTILEEYRIFLP